MNSAERAHRGVLKDPASRAMALVGTALCVGSCVGLVALGSPPDPFLSIEAFYASERWEYYQFLLAAPGVMGFILVAGALLLRVFGKSSVACERKY